MSREAAADSSSKLAVAASRLNAISAGVLGLTPEATVASRLKNAQLLINSRFGLVICCRSTNDLKTTAEALGRDQIGQSSRTRSLGGEEK